MNIKIRLISLVFVKMGLGMAIKSEFGPYLDTKIWDPHGSSSE